jgi:hypothetical protein
MLRTWPVEVCGGEKTLAHNTHQHLRIQSHSPPPLHHIYGVRQLKHLMNLIILRQLRVPRSEARDAQQVWSFFPSPQRGASGLGESDVE